MTADTNPVATFYRRTLIDLDKQRVDFAASGALPAVIDALDVYRASIQAALHTQGAIQ